MTLCICKMECIKKKTSASEGSLHAALAVVHYKLEELEQSQDLYARAYDIQVSLRALKVCTQGHRKLLY